MTEVIQRLIPPWREPLRGKLKNVVVLNILKPDSCGFENKGKSRGGGQGARGLLRESPTILNS